MKHLRHLRIHHIRLERDRIDRASTLLRIPSSRHGANKVFLCKRVFAKDLTRTLTYLIRIADQRIVSTSILTILSINRSNLNVLRGNAGERTIHGIRLIFYFFEDVPNMLNIIKFFFSRMLMNPSHNIVRLKSIPLRHLFKIGRVASIQHHRDQISPGEF